MAHYTSALLDALARLEPADEYAIAPRRARAAYASGAVLGRPALGRGADVVWLPAPVPVAVAREVPYVLTVHDRSWEERRSDFTRYEQLWHLLARPRRLARGAAAVITTTEHGRRDLIDAWGLDPGRVHAIPLAPRVSQGARPPVTAAYFLFVGAFEPRKAPDVLARAVAIARGRGLTARVVAVGEGRMPPAGVELLGRVDEERLAELYAGALALVAPSWLEGYGLPAVEALAHGTPVIVSDLPAVREVLGDAATYVPPGDAEALARALLAHQTPQRAQPLPGLSWDETARRTRAVLAAVAR